MSTTTSSSRLVRWLSTLTGAITRSLHDKLSETPPSLKDFGAVGDGVTDDTAAIQKAEACSATIIYTPPGTYLSNSLLVSSLTKSYVGEGQLKLAAFTSGPLNKRAKTLLNLSEDLTFGGVNSGSYWAGFNGDYHKNFSNIEANYSGNVFANTSYGTYWRPELFPQTTSIRNTVGRNGMVNGETGDRTMIAGHYQYLDQSGKGDMVAWGACIDITGASDDPNNFLRAGAAGFIGGQAYAYTDNCYNNPMEFQLGDNGHNIGCIGPNINMFRKSTAGFGSAAVNGAPTAPNHPWIGYRIGSYNNPIDVGYQAYGKMAIGLDFTGATFIQRGEVYDGAAITLKANQKVFLNAPATSYPSWSPLWPEVVSSWDNTYYAYDSASNSFMFVHNGTAALFLRKDITALQSRLQLPAVVTHNHANNAAALSAGLVTGDLYHTDGILKIVI